MKSPLLVAALSAWFFTLPALAQLGPAGVPGAPGLAETDPSVKTVKPTPIQPVATPSPTVEQKSPPKRTKVARKAKPQANCQAPSGRTDQRCTPKTAPRDQCSNASDRARCELHAKAHAQCKGKQGDAHRQCLRDTLVPKK